MTDRLRLRASGLEWRSLDGEVVALDIPRSLYMATNQSGTLLWEALGRGATHHELVQALVEEYSLDPAAAERDVAAFTAELRGNGLLHSEER
jgi:hypothetical protein